MRLDQFDFQLPAKLIAQKPASPRDSCRLMVINKNKRKISDHHFFDLEEILQPNDVLVFNNSRVIPARILFEHENKKFEIFLINKINENSWLTIGKPGKFLKKNIAFKLSDQLSFEVDEILTGGERIIKFSQKGVQLENALEKIGMTPFPPYIKNPQASLIDYQTIYAEKKGSVAAPTAGLHFTTRLLNRLRNKGIQLEFVTLHVGLGTFQSIKTKRIEAHQIHHEYFSIDYQTSSRLNKAYQENRRIIAVGTTTVRVLESAFDKKRGIQSGNQVTQIYIYPGYKWKFTKGLITNFHLPKSSLLLLTCAFADQELILKAYQEAVKKKYRFYSFGDAMLIL